MKRRTKKILSVVCYRLKPEFFSCLIKRLQSSIPSEYNITIKRCLALIDLGKKTVFTKEKNNVVDCKIDANKKVAVKLRLSFIAPAKGLVMANELFIEQLKTNIP